MINSLMTPPKRQTFGSRVGVIGAAYGFCVIWIALVVVFYGWLFKTTSMGDILFPEPKWFINKFAQWGLPMFEHYKLILFFFACIVAPFAEEVLFRVPLRVFKSVKNKDMLPWAAAFSSIIFGLMHQGSLSLLIQGVMGFVFTIVYIRNGYSYLSSVFLHFLWNTSLFFSLYSHL